MKSTIFLVPFLLFAITECKRDRNRHSGHRGGVQGDDNSDVIRNHGQCELEISCKGETASSTPVRLPIKGPRGPQGRQGEKGAPGEPGIPGTPGLPGKSANPAPQVAFFVGLQSNKGAIEDNTDLLYDRVVTNVGGGYDESTGRFTAPYQGVYHFNIVVAAQGRKKAAVMLMKNGTMVETIWAESIPFWATSSNNAILELVQHEQVWVVQLQRAPYLHGYMYSSFSGYGLFVTRADNPGSMGMGDNSDVRGDNSGITVVDNNINNDGKNGNDNNNENVNNV